jgi:hypothetical protein
MKVSLRDGAPRSDGQAEINVSKNGNILEIGAAGVEPAPVVIEYYEGKLTIRVYGEGPVGKAPVVFKQPLSTTPTPVAAKKVEPAAEPAGAAPAATASVAAPPVAPEPTDDELAAFDAA